LWYLGETERANTLMADALALAHDADHAFSLASTHEHAAILHQLSDEPPLTLEHAATALDMARAQGFAHHVAIAHILWGWSRAALGGTTEGLDEIAPAVASGETAG
jgi:hypothetical protein